MNRLVGVPGTVKMLLPRPRRLPIAVADYVPGISAHPYEMGDARILVGHEPAGPNGELLWHVSVSCARRYPTWDELKAAWYWLVPTGTVGAILLPRPENYVNVEDQDNVFHIWETRDPRALAVEQGR